MVDFSVNFLNYYLARSAPYIRNCPQFSQFLKREMPISHMPVSQTRTLAPCAPRSGSFGLLFPVSSAAVPYAYPVIWRRTFSQLALMGKNGVWDCKLELRLNQANTTVRYLKFRNILRHRRGVLRFIRLGLQENPNSPHSRLTFFQSRNTMPHGVKRWFGLVNFTTTQRRKIKRAASITPYRTFVVRSHSKIQPGSTAGSIDVFPTT